MRFGLNPIGRLEHKSRENLVGYLNFNHQLEKRYHLIIQANKFQRKKIINRPTSKHLRV